MSRGRSRETKEETNRDEPVVQLNIPAITYGQDWRDDPVVFTFRVVPADSLWVMRRDLRSDPLSMSVPRSART